MISEIDLQFQLPIHLSLEYGHVLSYRYTELKTEEGYSADIVRTLCRHIHISRDINSENQRFEVKKCHAEVSQMTSNLNFLPLFGILFVFT